MPLTVTKSVCRCLQIHNTSTGKIEVTGHRLYSFVFLVSILLSANVLWSCVGQHACVSQQHVPVFETQLHRAQGLLRIITVLMVLFKQISFPEPVYRCF